MIIEVFHISFDQDDDTLKLLSHSFFQIRKLKLKWDDHESKIFLNLSKVPKLAGTI